MNDKIVRDPVHDYIRLDPFAVELLDAPEMQRLRHTHQLGVSSLVYPGATHTRFAHSLGVYHLMRQATDLLRLKGQTKAALLAAAILHDVGHGPFSHLLEAKIGPSHEEWSCRIIESPQTRVNELLKKEGILSQVVSLIKKDDWAFGQLKSLISSQLDVDRMDYLLRDSYYSGVGCGKFDYYRLLHTMQIGHLPRKSGQTKGDAVFYWPGKSLHALEQYILARYYMYQIVYYHRVTRGYERLLEAIWDRARELEKSGKDTKLLEHIRPFIRGRKATVRDYLRLRECHVLSQIVRWKDSKTDPVLVDLSRRFLDRNGFKDVEVRVEGFDARDKLSRADEHLRSLTGAVALSPKSYLLEDSGGVQPYKPYRWEDKETQQPIMMRNAGSGFREITQESPGLDAVITKKQVFTRYYCPKEHKKAIEKILKS
jgi:HD superfamily phosphohydrolase